MGAVFSCEAKSSTDQILVEGSSVSAAVGNLLKVLLGGDRNASKVNGPKFFGLRCNEIVKQVNSLLFFFFFFLNGNSINMKLHALR